MRMACRKLLAEFCSQSVESTNVPFLIRRSLALSAPVTNPVMFQLPLPNSNRFCEEPKLTPPLIVVVPCVAQMRVSEIGLPKFNPPARVL